MAFYDVKKKLIAPNKLKTASHSVNIFKQIRGQFIQTGHQKSTISFKKIRVYYSKDAVDWANQRGIL